ncbi:MAG: cysteine--tRNA ligase [Firmicutes bacterium]|nr:cysteine--tRNA ligase [Bacillota bacterium]
MRVNNTLARQKEEFISREPGKVGMYVCGPTTYNYIHLGNARPIVLFDAVRRYLQYRGCQVTYVQNFTDIDDKIINRAREEGDDPIRLAERYVNEYFQDADALNVLRADIHPRVSQHLPEIIEMVSTLIEKGFAYEVEGDVYFNVDSFGDYGKLSGRSREEILVGARVEVDERKKNPMDFALWKAAKPGEPAWESPWGPGRPGWHIECSAMSMKYLGAGFDIHGGGSDLIFPHHENEVAQSEAYAGKGFVRYWLHNGFITVNQEKMSKSLGNFFLVRDILKSFPPQVVRFYLLSTHYRSPLDFDDGKLQMSRRGLERLVTTLDLLDEVLSREVSTAGAGASLPEEISGLGQKTAAVETAFVEAMDDDFNTALAIASLFDLSREINTAINTLVRQGIDVTEAVLAPFRQASVVFQRLLEVLGLDADFIRGARGREESEVDVVLIESLIEERQQARKNKDWKAADGIRDRLKSMGIVLEDSPTGTRWKRE